MAVLPGMEVTVGYVGSRYAGTQWFEISIIVQNCLRRVTVRSTGIIFILVLDKSHIITVVEFSISANADRIEISYP